MKTSEKIIEIVKKNPNCNSMKIAEISSLSLANVTNIMPGLVKDNLIQRKLSDNKKSFIYYIDKVKKENLKINKNSSQVSVKDIKTVKSDSKVVPVKKETVIKGKSITFFCKKLKKEITGEIIGEGTPAKNGTHYHKIQTSEGIFYKAIK
jgi:hypothetical protein